MQLNGGVTPPTCAAPRLAHPLPWQARPGYCGSGSTRATIIASGGRGLSDRRGDLGNPEMMRCAATGLALDDPWAQADAVHSTTGRRTRASKTNRALDLYTFIPAGMSADDAYSEAHSGSGRVGHGLPSASPQTNRAC